MEPALLPGVVAVVTYTTHAAKKPRNRKWHDGTLRVHPATRDAVLLSEDGKEVAGARLPADARLEAGSDEFQLDANVLVLFDSIGGGAGGAAPAAAPLAAAGRENVVAAVAAGAKGFAAPRAAPPQRLPQRPKQQPSWSEAPAAAAQAQKLRFIAPVPLPLRPPAAAPAAADAGGPRERSMDEIMRLLGGGGGGGVPSGLSRPFAAAQQRPAPPRAPAAAPAAKRARDEAPAAAAAALPRWGRYAGETYASAMPASASLADAQYDALWPEQEQARPAAAPPAAAPPPPKWGHSAGLRPAALPALASMGGPPAPPVPHPLRLPPPPPAPHAPPGNAGRVQLRFPSAAECARPRRTAAVPDRFPSAAAYRQSWEDSLVEEVNLKLAEVAQGFHAACVRAGGAAAAAGGPALEAAMQAARVPYHGQCELTVWRNYPGQRQQGGRRGGGKRRRGGRGRGGGGSSDSDGDDGGAPAKPDSCYLVLKSGRLKSGEYHKGDVWVISNHPQLRSGLAAGQPGDRSRAPWAAVARSLWHGPNQDGK
jgi:hypothetical protein